MISRSASLLPGGPSLAAIPVLDWRGPEFLMFYAGAFVVALIWTNYLIRQTRGRFELPQPPPKLTDPYEIAFLDGGPMRVQELVVLRLVKMGLAEYISGQPSFLVATGEKPAIPLDPLEADVFERITERAENGWPLTALAPICSARSRIESRLAAKGLRPTLEDLSKVNATLPLLPLFLVLALGGIKTLIGVSRDKPVLFLIFALGFTVIVLFSRFKALRTPFLTVAGRRALEAVRQANPSPTASSAFYDPNDRSSSALDPASMLKWSLGAALFGVAAVAGAEEFNELSQWLARQRNPDMTGGGSGGDSSSSSSCSSSSCSSSSCSSSSCGSSGCGGCGGGGGD